MCADLNQNPRTMLVCERASFLDRKSRLSAQMEQLHFNYKVSVLLPNCCSAPPQLDSVLRSFNSFYLIRNLPVYELLDPHFLQTNVYPGGVCGVSYRTRIDEDTCVALTQDGRLSLSLDKDSFELLGVEGKASRFKNRTKCRFNVSVDLTDSKMAPGGRGYQRLFEGLKSRLQLKVDFLLSHCSGDRALQQPLLSRYDWSEHRPEIDCHGLMQLTCPLLPSVLQSCDPHSLLEWLGAVHAHVSCENVSSSFLSSLSVPEPNTQISRALSFSVCGLLLPRDIQRLIQEVRCNLDQSQLVSWASVTVHGFVDSPVPWGDEKHGDLGGGDNFYNILMFPNHTYHLHLSSGTHTCPP